MDPKTYADRFGYFHHSPRRRAEAFGDRHISEGSEARGRDTLLWFAGCGGPGISREKPYELAPGADAHANALAGLVRLGLRGVSDDIAKRPKSGASPHSTS